MKSLFFISIALLMMAENLTAQHPRTEHWIMRTREFKAQVDTIPKGSVIFLGNSITEGFDLLQYFPLSKPINRGIIGDHIDGLIERLDYSVIELNPSRLFVLIGINDIGAGNSDSTILTNYEELLNRLCRSLPETQICVQSILPTSPVWSNCPKEKIRRLNHQIKEFVKARNLQWLDLYPEFVDTEGYLKKAYTKDGLHLNKTGYQKWYTMLKTLGLE
jgi:lysophospholipase L1-like esterase